MKRIGAWIFSLIILSTLLLSACGSQATPETTIDNAFLDDGSSLIQNPDALLLSDALTQDLDAAFGEFLNSMVGYNALHLADLDEMLAEEAPPFLLDVRSIDEIEEQGYIEGATAIPLLELSENLDLLPSFDTTIVAYCGSGWRCTIAMTALSPLGWNSVYVLKEGSYNAWAEAGYPVVDGMPEAVALHAAAPDPAMTALISRLLSSMPQDWGFVTAKDILPEINRNPDLIMIDVRTDDELAVSGLLEGAIHIPLEDFIERKADWPVDKDATIVIFSGYGHRSTIAMTILMTYGYNDVRSLGG